MLISGKSPSKSSNPLAGISNSFVKYENGVLSCSFTRAKSLAGVDHYFNLASPAYLLVAQGELSGGKLSFNFYNKLSEKN